MYLQAHLPSSAGPTFLLVAVPGTATRLVDFKPLLFLCFKKYFPTYLLFFSFSVCSVQNQTVLLTAPWGL